MTRRTTLLPSEPASPTAGRARTARARRSRARPEALLAALLLPTVALAAPAPPPAEVAACVACHGAAGEGLVAAGYPRLAGLSAEYLGAQLRAYADGSRANAIMAGMAKSLDAAQIQRVSQYFSTLSPPASATTPPGDAAKLGLGQKLAVRGDWDSGIPACFRCHGPGGTGVEPHFPPIVGQPAAYIEAQIKAWRDGSRRAPPENLGNALMQGIAVRMSDAQAQAAATWLAAQPSGAGVSAPAASAAPRTTP